MKIRHVVLECNQCHWKWVPRKEDVRQCPHCKSAYWELKTKMKKEKKVVVEKLEG